MLKVTTNVAELCYAWLSSGFGERFDAINMRHSFAQVICCGVDEHVSASFIGYGFDNILTGDKCLGFYRTFIYFFTSRASVDRIKRFKRLTT